MDLCQLLIRLQAGANRVPEAIALLPAVGLTDTHLSTNDRNDGHELTIWHAAVRGICSGRARVPRQERLPYLKDEVNDARASKC